MPLANPHIDAAATVSVVTTDLVIQPPRRSAGTRWPGVIVTAFVVLGVLLRIGVLVRNPSLWIDEAMLALNVVHRPAASLFEPLDLNQGAPIGFLLASKLLVSTFGPSEWVLRTVPFIASVVGLLLFVPLAYRLLAVGPARLAVVLCSLSVYLVGYAAEFKQYGPDAALAVGLLLLGRPVWTGTAGSGGLFFLAAGGAVAVWCSHPAVFVLGGIAAGMLWHVRERPEAWRSTLAVFATWGTSFAVCYAVFLRKLGSNQYLIDYWAGKFLPLPPIRPGDWAWCVDHYFQLFDKPGGLNGGFGLAGVAGVAFLIGLASLWRTDRKVFLVLVVPLLLALAASGVRKYPFAGRLMLFAVPSLLVGVAVGLSVVTERLRGIGPGTAWFATATVVIAAVAECNELRKKPLHAEDCREVLGTAWAEYQPGDKVYVYYGAVPAFAYYHPRFPFPATDVKFGTERRRNDPPPRFREELVEYRGKPRVWVVLGHRQTTEETALRIVLDGMGCGREVDRRSDAAVWLYDLSRTGP